MASNYSTFESPLTSVGTLGTITADQHSISISNGPTTYTVHLNRTGQRTFIFTYILHTFQSNQNSTLTIEKNGHPVMDTLKQVNNLCIVFLISEKSLLFP